MKPVHLRKLIAARRAGLAADTRFSWKDPAMPVIRDYHFANGRRMEIVDPDYERRYREMLVSASNNPSWRNDPTYNMKRKRDVNT